MAAQEGNAAKKLLEQNPAQTGEKVLPTASIGDVLKQLKPDFPDVTVSKIRFLESEGLITPRRSQSGYRRFSPEDIQRLRYILTHQRDNYLPLKVIKEQLDAMDAGKVTPVYAKRQIAGAMSAEQFRTSEPRRLTRADLTARAGVEDSFTGSLIRLGLVMADQSGFFSVDDITIVQLADRLSEFGLDGRHLKAMMTIAHRQLDLVSRVSDPLKHARDENARQRSAETAREVSALLLSLNAAIVKGNLD
ncbi:MerR family transcriptional regulator [Corynebacterium urealyticum]|uniref:Putative transcriptional regulator (MerR family) n=1 Tax=Corynebacterium urealyticum (strain ATCC 43042 / DSM 7109) TaxID=504474 RepID=B1VGZ1_CORU7|nr:MULTISPECIES: MerR family transcriptional regulator [Corynebacterium]AGE36647.1 putative transcriptional regulator (MerR family) [Corynebacterium urealyticum DSM 7111]MDK6301006.1 MerR family transcriptional regulator [Corynebacterium sp. UMB9976]MDK7135421.1 MerR family transcriptional regulator [Corynebacterium sp. UMB4614]QQB08278.1 MerR family transcriptional regulator [Corynebacterium urealyticum]QQC41533.1 MerR family transcriptional regulator [Corynebacterium urealyticum]